MFKRYSRNYSLWPEHARPRRSNSLKFAAGSFLLGVACAAAAYGVALDFGAPVAAQRREPGRAVQSIPVYTAAIEQPATTTPPRVGGEDRGSRTRVTATKTTLPIIGSQTEVLPLVATRGSDIEKLAGEAPEADVAKNTGGPTSLARREDRPEQKPQAIEARSDGVKPAAIAERSGKRSKTLVEKKHEGSKSYGPRNRQGRDGPTRLAKRQRPDQSSQSMMEAALSALRLATEGQGSFGM